MKNNLIAIAVLGICILSATAFDSYWRHEADMLIKEIAELKYEIKNHQFYAPPVLLEHRPRYSFGMVYE